MFKNFRISSFVFMLFLTGSIFIGYATLTTAEALKINTNNSSKNKNKKADAMRGSQKELYNMIQSLSDRIDALEAEHKIQAPTPTPQANSFSAGPANQPEARHLPTIRRGTCDYTQGIHTQCVDQEFERFMAENLASRIVGYYISNGGRFGIARVHNLMDRALSECGVLDDWRQPAALSIPGMRQDDASNLTRELLDLIIQVHAQGRIFGECFCTDANNHMLGDDRDLCNGFKALAELRAR
jgi:hypothetical protein